MLTLRCRVAARVPGSIRRHRLAILISALLIAFVAALSLLLPSTTASAATSFKLPWTNGLTFMVTQGRHQGYAYDFGLPEGTAVRAAAAGTVTAVKNDIASNVCGGSSYANKANYVKIAHSDGTSTLYLHLKSVAVSNGQKVAQGQQIGLSGKTGWTYCGPHLHFARLSSGGASVQVYFDEYPGRVLDYPMRVTSQNLPTGGDPPSGGGGDHFYTTSVSEPANAVASGYRWEGIVAYLSPGPRSGWVPLYRLWSSSGSDHFYTTSAGERDSAVARSGYVYEGVAGYVSPTPRTGLVPLYRLFSGTGGDHFYTTSAGERDSAVARSGYAYEGVAAYVSASAASGLVPLFRWWNGAAGDHFYTTSVSEPANPMASGYRWEGIAAYLSPGPRSGWVPLYRLWSSSGSDHFYTTSAAERDAAVARSGYVSEGVAGYVSPTPRTGLVPLYRLWNGSAGDHFYTTSASERDAAVARSGYVSEGVVGYVSAGAASGLVPFFRWWLP